MVWITVNCESRYAVTEARGQFGNPEEGEYPQFEAVTIKLVKRQHTEKTHCVLQ
jgi:hypothetical protein